MQACLSFTTPSPPQQQQRAPRFRLVLPAVRTSHSTQLSACWASTTMPSCPSSQGSSSRTPPTGPSGWQQWNRCVRARRTSLSMPCSTEQCATATLLLTVPQSRRTAQSSLSARGAQLGWWLGSGKRTAAACNTSCADLPCAIICAAAQIQTLIELRAIHLEQRGKMSRYAPLIVLEVLK